MQRERDGETKMMVRRPPSPDEVRQVEGLMRRIRDESAPFAVAEDSVDEFGGRKLSTDWRIKDVGAGRVSLERESTEGVQRGTVDIAQFAMWQRWWVVRESSEVLGLSERLKRNSEPIVVEAANRQDDGAPAWERGWQIESVDVLGRAVNLKKGDKTMRTPADRFIGWQMSWSLELSVGRTIAEKMIAEGLEAATVTERDGETIVTRGWTVKSVGDGANVQLRRKVGEATGMWSAPADEFARWQRIAEGKGGGPISAEYERLMKDAPRQLEVPDVVRELASVGDEALFGSFSPLPGPMEARGRQR